MTSVSKFFLFLAFLASANAASSLRELIVNGDEIEPSKASFFAKAGYDEYFFTNEVLCGAALIGPDILVSAAHCQGAFNHGVQILDPETNDFTRLVPIDRQIRHPDWAINRQKLNYDVLVMKLTTPLSSTDVAKPIALNADDNFPAETQTLVAYGFGITEDQNLSDHLRGADVTYISNKDCFGRGITFNNVMKSDEIMCTDPSKKDDTSTCMGDSGGPLVDETGSTLVGVISFGSGCQADHIPDGHARMSAVYDWIQEQICFISANPPDTCASTTKPRDPSAVEVVIDFTHDFYPEETTFAIRSKETLKNVYAGPEYIPTRNGNHRESVFLLPGEYTFDISDTAGDGLGSVIGDGSWKIFALYDGSTETEIASGDADFMDQQVTKFVVEEGTVLLDDNDTDTEIDNGTEDTTSNNQLGLVPSDQMMKCLDSRDAELASGFLSSTTCTCASNATFDDIVLECFHENGESCAYNYQTCESTDDCCGERTCRMGMCRSPVQVSLGRDRNRLGGTTVGGAAARSARGGGTARGGGNLRTR